LSHIFVSHIYVFELFAYVCGTQIHINPFIKRQTNAIIQENFYGFWCMYNEFLTILKIDFLLTHYFVSPNSRLLAVCKFFLSFSYDVYEPATLQRCS